jgi:glucokinase
MTRLALGLDFGGTKLAAGIVDLATERLVAAGQTDTPENAGGEVACQTMIDLAMTLAGGDRIDRIGVSFGGHVRQNRILRSVQVAGWVDFPLAQRLAGHFGALPCRIANDGNAMALGEWRFGAGQGADSLLYILVGTGIGSGLVWGGQLYEGSSGLAGEFGHVVAVPDGPLCPCGKRGCLEAVAAGPAIARQAAEALAGPAAVRSALPERTPLTAKIVAELADQGDELARAILSQAARQVGLAVGNAVNLIDVERVVIGGGVSRSGELWWQALRRAAHETIIPWRDQIDIRCSELGEFEGVWAAVALVA